MSRSLLLRLVIVLALIAGGIFAGLRYLRPTVIVEKVSRGNAPDAAPCTLTVLAERSPVVASEVAGRVASSVLEIGKHVAEGDVLVEIDPTELKLEIEQNQNDIAATKQKIEQGPATQFDLANERDALATKEELLAKGQIPQIEVDREKRAVALAEFRFAAEKALLEQTLATQENDLKVRQERLKKMTICSPITGVITQVYVGVGDLISGGAPIANMISEKRLVEARVSEENIKGIAVGQPAFVHFLPYGGNYAATVEKVLPAADPATQRYPVYLDVQIDPALLIPGITGEATIERARHNNVLIIPRVALFGRSVFVVKNGRVELRKIKTDIESTNLVEVVDGLTEGELIVVEAPDGFDRLLDGDAVQVKMKTSVVAADAGHP
jgi:RND family efflux transporter MFP subunit